MATEPSNTRAPAADRGQYLTFTLGDEVFAMNIRQVREIIQAGPMTTMPLMPRFVRGVINLRGAVVPVIDLQARFGRPQVDIGKKTCVVIFDAMRDGERADIGLMVDAVSEVVEIDGANVEPAPNFGAAIRRDFIQGMGKVGGRFVILLAPERAFDIDDMARICETGQEAALVD